MPFFSVPAGGRPIFSGNGAPAASLGIVGDLYIDKQGAALYGPKTAEGWGDPLGLAADVDVLPEQASENDLLVYDGEEWVAGGVPSHLHVVANVTGLQALLDGKAAASHVHTIGNVTGLQSALDGKAASAHTHAIENVTGLQAAIDGKAAVSHTHAIANVTGLQAALDGKQASGAYAASSHAHIVGDVTGLQSALDGKAATSHTHTIANVTGLQTALDGKQASGSYAAATHTHAISSVTGLQAALDGKQATLPAGFSHGDVLTWNGSAWFGTAVAAASISSIPGLQDALDSKASEFMVQLRLDAKQNTLPVGSEGNVLTWTGGGWQPGATPVPSGTESGQVLTWSQNTLQWYAAAVPTEIFPGSAVGDVLVWSGDLWLGQRPANANLVSSVTTGISGADQITNMVSLTQAEYDALQSTDAATLYVITG